MVKRGASTFSAASVAKGSVVLSRAIEKNFALEAEVSRLRHHISVLSRRLHFVPLERDGLLDMVVPTMKFEEFETWESEPQAEEEVAGEETEDEAAPSVAVSECPSVAMVEESEDEAGQGEEEEAGEGEEEAGEGTEEVAAPSVAEEESEEKATGSVAEEWLCERHKVARVRDWRREENTAGETIDIGRVPEMAEDCNRFKMDLVERVDSVPEPLIPSCVGRSVWERAEELEREGGWPTLRKPGLKQIDNGEGRRGLGSSGDEDAIIGGVIVAGGASQKAKNAARKKKRKIRWGEASGRSGGG